jgi:hypothetical protein
MSFPRGRALKERGRPFFNPRHTSRHTRPHTASETAETPLETSPRDDAPDVFTHLGHVGLAYGKSAVAVLPMEVARNSDSLMVPIRNRHEGAKQIPSCKTQSPPAAVPRGSSGRTRFSPPASHPRGNASPADPPRCECDHLFHPPHAPRRPCFGGCRRWMK